MAVPEEREYARQQRLRNYPIAIIAIYAYLGGLFDGPVVDETVLKIILTIDVLHRRVFDLASVGLTDGHTGCSWRTEARELSKADVLLAIQGDDANLLRAMAPHCEVMTVPMPAVPIETTGEQTPGRCLVISSNANNNRQGLLWLLENVWPLIIKEIPSAGLHVCGSICEGVTSQYTNVSLLGRVDELQAEYSAAQICLVPLRVGSGLKIKLVEAMAYGRACVSTTVGVQGVADVVGKSVLVADTPASFAEAVVQLLIDWKRRQTMEMEAIKYCRTVLAPEVVYGPLIARLRHQAWQMTEATRNQLVARNR